MNNTLTLLKLDLKSRFGFGSRIGSKNVLKWTFNLLYTLLLYAVVVVGIYFVTKMFVSNGTLNYHFLVLAAGIAIVIQLVVCTATLVKALYYSGDNEMLLRFPVSGEEIYLAKAAYVFINNLLISAAIMLPIYISYGALTNAGFGFFVLSVIVTVLGSLLPFMIANIIAIPVMMLVNVIRNQFTVILIVLIAIVVGAFSIYMTLLKDILVYIQTNEIQLFSAETVAQLDRFTKFAVPFNLYANVLYGVKPWGSFFAVLGITAVFGVGAFFIVKKFYFATILRGIETGKMSFTRPPRNRQLPVFITVLQREFRLIFRSVNYSFQYLCMAIAAPVMVYFCNDIAATVAVNSIGDRVLPGLTLLVVTIFVTVIVSFSSTAVSREGNNFYHTKVIPLSYSRQILIKMVLYGGVATVSVIASCIVVAVTHPSGIEASFVSWKDAAFIFAIAELVVIALTAISIRVDTVSPTFNVSGDGEIVAANKNVSISIIIGLLLAIIYGVSAMILSYLPFIKIGDYSVFNGTIERVYYILLILTGVIAAISVTALYVGLDKRYMRITGN